MSHASLTLALLPTVYAVCRLDSATPVPSWACGDELVSVSRTPAELSIVCPLAQVPAGIVHEGGWRCLRVAGPLDFALTGILVSLAAPLAEAGISIFALSTYDTDYILLQERQLANALLTLATAGHRVQT